MKGNLGRVHKYRRISGLEQETSGQGHVPEVETSSNDLRILKYSEGVVFSLRDSRRRLDTGV
jgi:hypothetical protein